MRKGLLVIRHLIHAGALVFGAFWLVATTQLAGPPRDCFTGIDKDAKLQVTLGSTISDVDGGAASHVSCNALDGLAPGGALTFTLSQASGNQYSHGLCRGYETREIVGTNGVTLWQQPPYASSDALTVAGGTFSGVSGCVGSWTIDVAPETPPPRGELISPLEAGQSQPWSIVRAIRFDQPCGGAFADPAVIECEDRFAVASIAVAP